MPTNIACTPLRRRHGATVLTGVPLHARSAMLPAMVVGLVSELVTMLCTIELGGVLRG